MSFLDIQRIYVSPDIANKMLSAGNIPELLDRFSSKRWIYQVRECKALVLAFYKHNQLNNGENYKFYNVYLFEDGIYDTIIGEDSSNTKNYHDELHDVITKLYKQYLETRMGGKEYTDLLDL